MHITHVAHGLTGGLLLAFDHLNNQMGFEYLCRLQRDGRFVVKPNNKSDCSEHWSTDWT